MSRPDAGQAPFVPRPRGAVAQDVRSVPVFATCMVLLAVVAVVVARHDWDRAIRTGRAHAHAEAWAMAMLAVVPVNLGLAIPRPGSWLYFLVIGTFFSVMLPTAGAVRVTVLSTVGAVVAEVAAGSGEVVLVTASVVILTVGLVAHGIGDVVALAIADARRRAGLIETVAESAELVSILDPTEVPERVADAAMRLGFDVVVVTERDGDQHRVVVERSRVGPVFHGEAIPLGPAIRDAVEARRLVVRTNYLAGPSPNPQMAARGMDSVVVSPVLVDHEVVALLVGALREPEIDQSRLESFTLLGRLLSQALGNARRYERERAAVAELDELARLKDYFLSNVSHELRTPITVILGGLLTLQTHDRVMTPRARGELVRRAVTNAETLESTLGALLEFARIERGSADATLREVELAPLVRSALDRLAGVLGDHCVTVDDEQAVVVRAAPGQLDRVVDNLLLNAARHTPPGTNVTVRVVADGPRARVEVEDDGPGVAPVDVPRLTDRFFRGGESTTRESRGLGLGLALSERILEAHGSRVDVWSEPGVGARFSFELPLVPART